MDQRQTLLRLLRQECAEEAQLLTEMGLAPSFENAVLLSQVKKAARGDAAAAKYIRELLGEEPGVGPSAELADLSDRELLAILERGDE